MEQRDRPQPPVLALGDGGLVQLEGVEQALPSADRSADSDTMTVAAMRTIVTEMSGPSPRPLAK